MSRMLFRRPLVVWASVMAMLPAGISVSSRDALADPPAAIPSLVGQTPGQMASGAPAPAPAVDERDAVALNGIAFVQTSAEYEACTLQTYASATRGLDDALRDPTWTAADEQTGDLTHLKQTAVILDVDETCLNNGHFQATRARDGVSYMPERFSRWIQDETPGPTASAGAAEFCNAARAKGIEVIYLTSRLELDRPATLTSLRRNGFPIRDAAEDVYIAAGTRDKSYWRTEIAKRYRILMLIGDALGDFAQGSRGTPAERTAVVRSHAGHLGKKWFMLPNPMYGDWERSLYRFQDRLSLPEKSAAKWQSLRYWTPHE
jgi:5'-nucleotidase (lipoprotein e(P4) family)